MKTFLPILFALFSFSWNVASGNNANNPFGAPDEITVEQLRADLEARKAQILDGAITLRQDDFFSYRLLPALIERGVEFDFEQVAGPALDFLLQNGEPDFELLSLVRVLYQTEEFNERILSVVRQLPLWIFDGQLGPRIYTTENHMLMYTSAAYLLRQKFPDENFIIDDELDARLDWVLRDKIDNGMFEYNSHTYNTYSLGAMLNLYDLAEDENIRNLAEAAIKKSVSISLKSTNCDGFNHGVAGRTRPDYYFNTPFIVEEDDYYKLNAFFVGAELIIPAEPERRYTLHESLVLLGVSGIDLAETIKESYTSDKTFEEVSVGFAKRDQFKESTKVLSFRESIRAQLTMGTFLVPEYVGDVLEAAIESLTVNVDFLEDAGLNVATLPPIVVEILSNLLDSISRGSILNPQDWKIYKHRDVMITGTENFLGGRKGFEQMPWMMSAGSAVSFVHACPFAVLNGDRLTDQIERNDQTPFVLQKQNVLVSIFNPRSDIVLTDGLLKPLDIRAYFHLDQLDEVVPEAGTDNGDPWVYGRKGDGYMALRRHCLGPVEQIQLCQEELQVYVGVVGNDLSHGSFENFIDSVNASSVEYSLTGKCVELDIEVDGQTFEDTVCSGVGNLYLGIIGLELVADFAVNALASLLA